jgi:hypothetical protein
MTRTLRRNLLLAVAAAAVIAGLVLALVFGGGHSGHHSHPARTAKGSRGILANDATTAARYLGITRAALRRRLRDGTLSELADATPGRSAAGLTEALLAPHEAQLRAQHLSQSEEAARVKTLRERVSEEVQHRRHGLGDMAVAARYLGVTEAALRSKLLQGHSLAALAKSTPGASRSGLIALIVKTRTKRLEAAVTARTITLKEERSAISLLEHRAVREVDRTLPQH